MVSAAVVDYGFGNLFSVRQACLRAGMAAKITAEASDVEGADVVVLPGVGAFGDAMDSLRSLGMVEPLRAVPERGGILLGVCLGLQLLMSESEEFGRHKGLGIVQGDVVRLNPGQDGLKVPHIGWAPIEPVAAWGGTALESVPVHTYMYFLHAYRARPASRDSVLSTTRYGEIDYCSSLHLRNVFATQFHPERSGPAGLRIYAAVARMAGQEEEANVAT